MYQKLEPELHGSVTKLLQTNELDHFIDSDTDTKITCFQVAIFSSDMDSNMDMDSKCHISHPAIEFMVIKITLQ